MENVLNSLPVALYVKDKNLEYTWANKNFIELCQVQSSEIGGRSAFDLFNEDVACLAHEHDIIVLERGETRIFDAEIQVGGKTKEARIIKLPVFTPKKTIAGIISLAFDRSHDSELNQELVKGLTSLKQQNEQLLIQNMDLEASLRYSEDNAASIIELAETKSLESEELRERTLDLESSLAFTEDQANQLAELAEQLDEQRRQIAEHNAQIERMMYRDDITGAHTRRYFFDRMPEVLEARKGAESKGALAMLDIDFFKSVNDKYGHLVGDDALRAFVEVVSKNLPEDAVFCRVGGEEFTILTPGIGMGQIRDFLEGVRQTVASHRIGCLNNVFKLTVSIGAVEINGKDDLLTLLNKADKALYKAKMTGRNQVVYYDESQ